MYISSFGGSAHFQRLPVGFREVAPCIRQFIGVIVIIINPFTTCRGPPCISGLSVAAPVFLVLLARELVNCCTILAILIQT